MSVELNHTIVHVRDRAASAAFVADIIGLTVGAEWGPFIPVTTSNGVTLDYAVAPDGPITPQHYAFLVSDGEFDAAFRRIRDGGVTYYADPHLQQRNVINHHFGGRGLYFLDPDGHVLEIITTPYGETPPE